MKTITQKDDGRFERLNISVDNLPEVDLIVNLLRDAQDSKGYHNNKRYTDNQRQTVDSLLEELEQITYVEPIEL